MIAKASTVRTLSDAELTAWEIEGYYVARGLIRPEEVAEIKGFFDGLAAKGEPVEGHWTPDGPDPRNGWAGVADPLKRYPRVMHPHLFNDMSKRYLIDPRFGSVLRQLLGDEPVAVQTMYYFKPPGARGQALHQDNFYLKVRPGSCIAAWVAIDRSYPENGGLYVCPGTHKMDVQCPEKADSSESFTVELVNPPPGCHPTPLVLEPGDVLFFNGSVVHGSKPNGTKDEWRRSFICHYMPASSTHIASWYHAPMIGFDGQPVFKEMSVGGGPCGTEKQPAAAEAVH